MSAKWQRSKAWDERFFPAWAWPAKFVLRALSSIPLAVVLLVLVGLYGVVASVPIGMLALVPTYLIVALTLAATLALVAWLPVFAMRRVWRSGAPAARFAASLVAGAALAAVAAILWARFVWPSLRWDPVHETGLRLFPDFCATYMATTLRRLPFMEMSELEFYAWWPLRVILLLFILNMFVATVRRIEFRFVNIGVLTVHAGIITLALGSIYYSTLKQEGDTLLFSAAQPGEPGPAEGAFYDHLDVALWAVERGDSWEQRRLDGVPRYNDYGVPWSALTLDLPVGPSPYGLVDDDIAFRVVGYASYADLKKSWRPEDELAPGETPNPVVDVELLSSLNAPDANSPARVVGEVRLVAGSPAERVASFDRSLAIEATPASQTDRWQALTMQFPSSGEHALVVRNAPGGAPSVFMVSEGSSVDADGWKILVKKLYPTVPFPIITPGYEGADSSVALLQITPPDGKPYDRYVYHRFPELDQDITGTRDDGRPIRRPADPALRVAYVDATMLQVYLRTDGAAAVRQPGGRLTVVPDAAVGGTLSLAPRVSLRVARRWPGAHQEDVPVNVPAADRQRDMIGTHNAAAAAVRVSLPSGWSKTVWIPFTKFMGIGAEMERRVDLPDGRSIKLAFSRLSRPLPNIALQLVDFEMIPYPHSEIPRDYVSLLRVTDMTTGRTYEHETRLNTPLIHRAPFRWSSDRSTMANALGRLISLVAPNQYKFSQAGWDVDGWRQTTAEMKEGRRARPRASFTILGVGNNPGIYIIAAGAVMMSVGIPWAFYVKPLIQRRKKRRIQRELSSAGAPAQRGRAAEAAQPVGVTS